MKATYTEQDIKLLQQNSGKLTFNGFYDLLNGKINQVTLRKILKRFNIEMIYEKEKKNKFDPKHLEELKQIAHGMTYEELINYFNNKYDYEFLVYICWKNNIEVIKQEKVYATDEDIKWLKENAPKLEIQDIYDYFDSKWDKKNLRLIMKNHGITWLGENSSGHNRNYKVNVNFFENITTPEQMYVLGIFITDGHIDNKQKSLVFKQKDKDIVEIVKKVMGAEQPIMERKQSGEIYYSLIINSVKLYNDLVKMGFHNKKTYDAKVPNNLPEEYYSDLIRGMIDGDGFVSFVKDKRESTVGLVGTKDICEFFKHCMSITIPKSNTNIQNYEYKGHIYQIAIKSRYCYTFLKWVYQNSENLRCDRKYQKYLEICNYYENEFQLNKAKQLTNASDKYNK